MGQIKEEHIAILTVKGLDKMTKPEIKRLKKWLLQTEKNIGTLEYSKLTRFRLIK
jgi:hypothetical protein